MAASSALPTFTHEKCCAMHEWPVQCSCAAALNIALEVRFGPEASRDLIDSAAAARAELRFIRLSRHLETPSLLTTAQIARYSDLRGYGTADPSTNVPEGHGPAMWRRHNKCE